MSTLLEARPHILGHGVTKTHHLVPYPHSPFLLLLSAHTQPQTSILKRVIASVALLTNGMEIPLYYHIHTNAYNNLKNFLPIDDLYTHGRARKSKKTCDPVLFHHLSFHVRYLTHIGIGIYLAPFSHPCKMLR